MSKGVNDANEEILLFCIGEELYIPLTAVVTDHGKAGSIVFTAVIVSATLVKPSPSGRLLPAPW